MYSISKMLMIGALFATPQFASAEAVCNTPRFRGNWILTSVFPDGSPGTCAVRFNRQGGFTGDCYAVNASENPPLQQFVQMGGDLTFNTDCSYTGSFVLGATTVTLEGRAWASRGARPTMMSGAGYMELGGTPYILTIDMYRRPNSPAFQVPSD